MNYKDYIVSCIGMVCAFGISYVVSQTSLGTSFDRVLYDTFAQDISRNDIVVVGVDDKSLQEIGSWPWNRDIFAAALINLKDARVVAFDVLFLEERVGDDTFKKVLEDLSATNSRNSAIIMASKITNGVAQKPIYQGIQSGLVHVMPEDDGVVRTIGTHTQVTDGCLPHFAYQVFATYTKNTTTSCPLAYYGFPYIQNPVTISFADIYKGNITTPVKDKIVFIGATSLDMGDMFVGPSGERIPGVIVHASFTQALLNNTLFTPLSNSLVALFICIGYSIIFMITRIARVFVQILCIGIYVVSVIVASAMLLEFNYTAPYLLLLLPALLLYIYEILYRYIYTHKKNIKIGALFGSYVNTTLLQSLLKEGNTVSLGGARKRITVLFSDIRDFTTFSEAASPEHLVATMNTYFSYMTPAVTENLGTIDKYIGDAIMAFWNAPLDVEHHEERAVQAALAMRHALKDYNKASGNSFKIGIGIHAGEAVVGNIGSKERISYTALGDTVNVSSRVEGLTKQYGADILVTQEVVDAVQSDRYTFTYIDTISVKGRGKQVILYTVVESV